MDVFPLHYYYFIKSTLFLLSLFSYCNAFNGPVLFDTGQAQTVLPFKYNLELLERKDIKNMGLIEFSTLV